MTTPECFDPDAARLPTRVVPTSSVVDLLDETHAREVVAAFRAAMLAGDRFPPVAVLPLGGRLLLADGHKRLSAYRSLSRDSITVEVWTIRRWLVDQAGQLARNARKNATIARRVFHRPREAAHLAGTTLAHWRRVVRSLVRRARSRD